jgi:5-deoxy-glucuronate isomerase
LTNGCARSLRWSLMTQWGEGMSQSRLLVRPASGEAVHAITPASAGWRYVGFEVVDLASGGRRTFTTGGRECCIVVQSGKLKVTGRGFDSGVIGERTDVFAGLPWSVYLPPGFDASIEAETDAEAALCFAPASKGRLPRVIRPTDVETLTRGKGSNTRHVRNILSETSDAAESLLVVEVITPGGNWSSYPPHKHDRDDLPRESLLEETYYHRLNPRQGYAFQRVYTEDGSLDETMTVHDRDVVMVPCGYHPVGTAHGYDLCYLNVMAGPKRTWRFHNEPAHEWMLK